MKQEILNTEKNKINNLSETFKNYIHLDQIAQGFCFTVCYHLQFHLNVNGFNSSIVAGHYDSEGHYWLKLDDYNEIIVDPTITQFENYKEIDKTYIGKSDKHKAYDFQCEIILGARNIWKEKIIKESLNNNLHLLIINLKAATKIINENGAKIPKIKEYSAYYDDIKQILTELENKIHIDKLTSTLPKSFLDIKNKMLNR
jgi:hypothetical protein